MFSLSVQLLSVFIDGIEVDVFQDSLATERASTFDVTDERISLNLPNAVELTISESAPGVQGDRAQGGTKPATLETGAAVQVPLFLNEGDVVKVDTRTGEYVERVSS